MEIDVHKRFASGQDYLGETKKSTDFSFSMHKADRFRLWLQRKVFPLIHHTDSVGSNRFLHVKRKKEKTNLVSFYFTAADNTVDLQHNEIHKACGCNKTKSSGNMKTLEKHCMGKCQYQRKHTMLPSSNIHTTQNVATSPLDCSAWLKRMSSGYMLSDETTQLRCINCGCVLHPKRERKAPEGNRNPAFRESLQMWPVQWHLIHLMSQIWTQYTHRNDCWGRCDVRGWGWKRTGSGLMQAPYSGVSDSSRHQKPCSNSSGLPKHWWFWWPVKKRQ